jgi:hypothetical protein
MKSNKSSFVVQYVPVPALALMSVAELTATLRKARLIRFISVA